jgi:type IV fimbrial biogenesis protein FimT
MARRGRIPRIVSFAQASLPSLRSQGTDAFLPVRSGLQMKLSAGFTLIELLVVITIIAILMGVGAPSYKYVTVSNRMSAEVNGLLGDMQLARAEAVKNGSPVTVCSSANGASCSGSTDWSQGWIVYTDPTDRGVVDPGEVVLRVQKALHAGDTLVDKAGTLSAATFNRAGLLSATGMDVSGITLTLHDPSSTAAYTRCLWIASQGMITTQKPTTDAGCQ